MGNEMTEVYRFRDIEKLLGKRYCELERQTIYFANPDQLNDPMEGVRDIVWRGDKIVWTNLFKHYAFCLNNFLLSFRVLGNYGELEARHISIMGRWDEPPASLMAELFNIVWNKIYEELGLSLLIENLERREREVRSSELQHYLYLSHFPMIARIQEAHVVYGLAPEEERLECQNLPLNALLEGSDYFELLHQLESEHENFSENWFLHMQQVTTGQRLKLKYSLRQTRADTFERNKQLVLFDFTDTYIEQLGKLLWPHWYAACFTRTYSNSSVWANYTDGHRGVCLIFETDESPGGISLEVERVTNRSINSKGDIKENWGFAPMIFHDIDYKDRPISIEFFRNMGRLPVPALMKLWYTDEEGNISECASHFCSGNEEATWMQNYWGDFIRNTRVKSQDWSYENESRLILYSPHEETLKNERRLLKYNFESLKGIIFGIRTSDEDKLRIIEIIRNKCLNNNRTDFKFFQAFYWPQRGEIRKSELKIF